jgi:Ca2+/Na+ antiporter
MRKIKDQVLNIIDNFIGRYLIYFFLGFSIPFMADEVIGNTDSIEYWILLIITLICMLSYMITRDWRHYK